MYLWADGIYSGLRAEDEKLCLLVVIGVPLLSSVSIVMRRCNFKTFTPSSPEMVREERTSRPQAPRFRRLFGCSRWGSLTRPQVGEFGWPPGLAL